MREVFPHGCWRNFATGGFYRAVHLDVEAGPAFNIAARDASQAHRDFYLDPPAITEAIHQKPCGTCEGSARTGRTEAWSARGEPFYLPCPDCTNGLLPPAEPELRAMIEGLVA